MQLVFDAVETVGSGEKAVATNMPDQTLIMFVQDGGQIEFKESDTTLGQWSNRSWSSQAVAGPDSDVEKLSMVYLSGAYSWLTWLDGTRHRVAIYPNELFDLNPDFINGLLCGAVDQIPTSESEAIPAGNMPNAFAYGYAIGLKAIKS